DFQSHLPARLHAQSQPAVPRLALPLMHRPDSVNMLRHSVATLAYRGAKVLRGAPKTFANYRAGPDSRTPVAILAHIGDLMEWALYLAQGKEAWHDATPLPWEDECKRFFRTVEQFDAHLASEKSKYSTPETLLQGPVADAI